MSKIEVLQDEVRSTARNKDKHETAFLSSPTRENSARMFRASMAYADAVDALQIAKGLPVHN